MDASRCAAFKSIRHLVLAAALGAGSLGTFGQEQPAAGDDLTELSLEQLVQIEIPSVVGASKYEQKANEAPSSVSVITADQIRKYGYLTLADILRSVRGFYVGNDRNYNFLGVRGFSLPGDYNSRVLLLIDGHRINESVFQSANIEGIFPLDVDLIERVEVIRGPGSSLYGSSAFFAVINVVPKRGADFQGAEVAAGVGSFSAQNARLTFGKKFDNGLDVLLSASAFDNEGNDQLFFSEFAGDPTKNNGVLDRADGDQWKNVYAGLHYADFKFAAVLGRRRKNYGTGLYDGTVFNSPDNFTVDAHQYLDLQYDRALSGEANVFGRIYLSRYDYWGEAAYDLPPLVTNKDETDGEWWGGELKYTTRIGKRHRLTVGGEYIDYTQADQRNYDGDPDFGCVTAGAPTIEPCLNSRQAFKTWGLYLQDEVSVTDKLILSLGLRYDDLYQGRSSTNPRLGLIYSPSAATSVKFLYGTAFRAPSAYERYYSVLGFKENPDLDAEEIQTVELALEHSFNKNLRGIASVYRYRLDNLIGLVIDPVDELNVFRNLAPIDANGLELELDAKWSRLEGRVSYSYQDVQDKTTGATLLNSPKHLGKLNVIVPVLPNRLFAGFEAQYVAQRDNVHGDTVPGYTVANLTLTARNWVKGLELSAGVYNLFDKDYGDPASADDDPLLVSIPQDGRTYRAKLIYRF